MSGYLSLRAITYRTHSLNLIHLELPPSFTACLIDFRFPLNVFPILFLLTRELFMFCTVLSFLLLSFFPLDFLLFSVFHSCFPTCLLSFSLNAFTPSPGSLVVCDLHLTFLCLLSSPALSQTLTCVQCSQVAWLSMKLVLLAAGFCSSKYLKA